MLTSKANNVDIRYGMKLGSKTYDIVTAGLRVSNTLGIYRVDGDSKSLISVAAREVKLGIEAYGSCMYKDISTNTFYAIINDKEGNQVELPAPPKILTEWEIKKFGLKDTGYKPIEIEPKKLIQFV